MSQRLRHYYVLALIFVLLAGYMFIHIFNGRFTLFDFQVYHRAAGRLVDGQNLYKIAEDGMYIYKYSAVSAFYFIPLSWLSIGAAKVVYWLSSALAFCGVLVLIYQLGESALGRLEAGRRNLLMLISFICMGAFIELEIHLGQVNVFVLLLLLWSARLSLKGRPATAGFMLAASLFIKPFGLALMGWFLYRLKFREVIFSTGFMVILFLLPLFFYGSFEFYHDQNRLWIQELITELGNKQDLLAPRTHTIFSVLARYTPLRWIEWSPGSTLIFQFLVLIVTGGSFIWLRYRRPEIREIGIYEISLLFCLVPLILYTNRNLYIFTGPAVALLLTGFGRLGLWSRMAFIAGMLISCFNIIEIWGKTITACWEDLSLITVGTVIIWIVLYVNVFRWTRVRISVS